MARLDWSQAPVPSHQRPATVSRREILRGATGAAGVAVLGLPGTATPVITQRPAQELSSPRAVKSAGGLLAVDLTCQPGTVDVGLSKRVSTVTFNGIVPAETWELEPGDTLKVNLVNNLPELPSTLMPDMTRPHLWTNTNLHTHGLHVSPSGNSDNIFLDIPPGGSQKYEIHLPKDHPSGLFWYHPHRHGAVAQQVRGGMAGMIIVRGEIDRVEEVRAAKEQIMVLQALELGDDLQLLDPIPHPTKTQAFYPRTHILYTVNGVLNPKITMYPGEVQRWRLLNAAEGKFMSLALQGHELNVLAWDGLTQAAPEPASTLMMSSGNRVELLVKAGKRGTYQLMLTPGSSQKPIIPGMPAPVAGATPQSNMTMTAIDMPGMPIIASELDIRSIVTVEVKGSGPEMSLPTALPAWDPPMLPVTGTRKFAFTVERDATDEFITFAIDFVPYADSNPPYQVKLGTAEEWTLTNASDHKLMNHAHTYHIHVNPFLITRINDRTLDKPLWRDTFVLTGTTGDSFTFRSNFVDYAGKFVEHCHVLTHEDLGMMSAIEVIP